MLTILQECLFKQYPTIFPFSSDYLGSQIIECGDGWFTLLDTLSALISVRSSSAVVQQIRVSYGSLLVSISGYEEKDYDYIFGVTNMVYWLSQLVCEKCGCKGSMFNSHGITARCELHDRGLTHRTEYDESGNLPFKLGVNGAMWRQMVSEFHELTQTHAIENGMPPVFFGRVDKTNGKLNIQLNGGDEMTKGMADLLIAYAAKIDEETGEIVDY
jgi:hypothetical protein